MRPAAKTPSKRGRGGVRGDGRPGVQRAEHVVVAGSCWLRLGADRLFLYAGDLVLLPRGSDRRLGDTPDGPATPLSNH